MDLNNNNYPFLRTRETHAGDFSGLFPTHHKLSCSEFKNMLLAWPYLPPSRQQKHGDGNKMTFRGTETYLATAGHACATDSN